MSDKVSSVAVVWRIRRRQELNFDGALARLLQAEWIR